LKNDYKTLTITNYRNEDEREIFANDEVFEGIENIHHKYAAEIDKLILDNLQIKHEINLLNFSYLDTLEINQ
jgi:hypothetical protein